MITLREIAEVFWTITEVRITARQPGTGRFLHEWVFGKDVLVSVHMRYAMEDGKLTIVDKKINAHGDATRGGSEIGWGLKTNLIQKELLDAPITRMTVSQWGGGRGHGISVDVELKELTVETLKQPK